jgi:hypothetical protein
MIFLQYLSKEKLSYFFLLHFIALLLSVINQVQAWSHQTTMSITGTKSESNHINRRAMLVLVHNSLLVTVAVPVTPVQAMEDANALINELKECKQKMMTIPELLKQQEWDSVRTILKTPPVNRLWNLGDVSFHVDDVFWVVCFQRISIFDLLK